MNTNQTTVWLSLIIVNILSLIQGCAVISEKRTTVAPIPCPEYIEKEYAVQDQWIEQSSQPLGNGSIRIILTAQNRIDLAPIVLDYHQAEGKNDAPAILVSPILGGKNRVATHFAHYFSRRGYHAMVVHRPSDLKKDIEDPAELGVRLRNAVIRDRAALDWLCGREEVDPSRIGSFGVSYGGIKNCILAGVDRRLKANVIALAGADLASIITHSNLDELQHLVDRYQTARQCELQEIERYLRSSIRTEPARFAPYIDPSKTMLILARMDATVPRRNGEMLREALGYPTTIYLPTGHYSSVMFTDMLLFPYIEKQALRFFDEKLEFRHPAS